MKKQYKILTFVVFFFLAFAPPLNPPAGNWYQQFMPFLNNRTIRDITFTDSLTGYSIAGMSTGDTNYVLKTVNGGDNWSIIFRVYKSLNRVIFLDNNTGYICGGGANYLAKSTNGGLNWQQVSTPNGLQIVDMYVLSADTIWIMDDYIGSHIYLTTNGGLNWILQYTTNSTLSKIYFFNYRIGFMCTSFNLYKTNDGGFNWTEIVGQDGFLDIYFIDSLTGWKAKDSVKKTTNGGLNWQTQQVPRGPNIGFGIYSLSNINRDTIWGVGGIFAFPNSQIRGIIYRTTNGGNNWLFQLPDTSYNINAYGQVQFINKNTGWAYSSQSGIHTTTGGNDTFFTGLQQVSSEIPKQFKLYQNYPNPFNPRTVIPYSLSSSAYVEIIAYDVTGREVQRMVDSYHQAGAYEVDFMGKFTSSGVYLYRMTVTDSKERVVYMETKKMILLK